MPKISVVMITYKQENLVKRAIDSLLEQKEYIYEICISDDCSPDNTWKVLQDYDKQYPGLFKLHRNEHNLGIFQNVEESWKLPTGDIIYQLSGDDECGKGYFKHIVDFIRDKKIDYKNELFCIYGDFAVVSPDGKMTIKKNDFITKNDNSVKLKIRGLVTNRATCYSINVMRKFEKVSEGRSYHVELAQDAQLQIFTEKNYYMPYCGNIYYSQIGVSKKMSVKEACDIAFGRYDKFLKFADRYNVKLFSCDRAYIEFSKLFAKYRSHKKTSIIFLLKLFYNYLKSIDLSLGIHEGCQLKLLKGLKKRFA